MAKRSSGFGWFMLLCAVLAVLTLILRPAPEPDSLQAELVVAREATGGAPTREEIMARQRGETVDDSYRRSNIGDPDSAAALTQQLGTLGGASDPELWRALRFNEAAITVSPGSVLNEITARSGLISSEPTKRLCESPSS